MDDRQRAINRRRFVECLSAAGAGAALMPGALAAVAQDANTITLEMLEAAQQIAGVVFSPDEQRRLLEKLNGERGYLAGFHRLRTIDLGTTPPAIVFNPIPPGKSIRIERRPLRRQSIAVSMPTSNEALAFLPVTHLSRLVETRQVTPTALTKLYLARLKQFDPRLHCVVNLTEALALQQAAEADREIAAGRYRGPLHGIPYGLKDLFAVRGVKTTWGMTPYTDRVIDTDATVYTRLMNAGAILVAKLSTGALAVSAQWFGGVTRNPWNTAQDAAGSSAGPGAATAAGLVGFSIGSDTGGSIIAPSTRNGVSGLRPTFGRVSRYGAMTLAWTQDTVGPMCRSSEDCALVFDAIYGPDGRDNTIIDVPFNWDAGSDVSALRVGYLDPSPGAADDETRRNMDEALRVIRSLGVRVEFRCRTSDRGDRLHPLRGDVGGVRRRDARRRPDRRGARAGAEPPARRNSRRALRPRGRIHPGEPLPHARDAATGRGVWRSRPVHRQQPGVDQPHRPSSRQRAERLCKWIADCAAPDRQVVRRAGDPPPGPRVPVEDRLPPPASAALG
jgi:Asp-tRNA(Asn)/Glu-tRNA(Gln) amidotransferase A subunit family amidase